MLPLKSTKNNKKMTSREAINAMESAIKIGDKKKILELFSPDNADTLPDWDYEPDYIWVEWEELLNKAEQILEL